MSRKNARLARITDLQCHQPDIILTKKDCDTIAEALWAAHKDNPKEILGLYCYLKNLSKIRKGRCEGRELRPYPKQIKNDGGQIMKTFNVNLIVEADDDDATEGFIERIVGSCFDSYDGYLATSVSVSSIDETEEIEPPSFEEAQGEFNSYNVVLNG